MKRIDFLRNTTLAGASMAASSIPLELFAKESLRKVTILHTNDQHSRIEPFPMDGGKYQGLGGFAQRAALIKEIRKQEKNVLLLDSGDIWQGTPYFNKYGGELEFKLMTEMKYDASTLGNHDFDAGIDGFLKQLPHAGFKFLNCNYDFSDSALNGKIAASNIFKFDDVKIGVFGVGIELQGLVPKDLCAGVQYKEPIQNAQRVANELKYDFKCDYVICLSHLGYKYDDKKVSDVVLAESTKNIDLILGGHTHTFFDKPEVFRNAEQKKVMINQVGWAGLYIGRIDLFFQQKSKRVMCLDAPILVEKR
jgi:5'-nucleotidase